MTAKSKKKAVQAVQAVKPVSNRKLILIALAIITFAVGAYYRQILFRTGHQWDDFVHSHGPYIMFNCTTLASGKLPLWIPYMHCGYPNLPGAVPHWSYPGNFLLILFTQDGMVNSYWLQLTILVHVVLLGFFAFLYFKHRNVNYWISILGGISTCLGGHFAFTLHWPAVVMGLCWIPLLLIFLDRYIDTGKFKNILWTGMLAGLCFIAGTPQWVLYAYLFIFLYFLVRCFLVGLQNRSFKIVKRFVFGLVSIFLIAGLTSAVRLVPEFELVRTSGRAVEKSYSHDIPWKMLANIVFPHAFGEIEPEGTGAWSYWGKPGHFKGQVGYWHYWENGNYVGFIPLLFFPISFLLLRKDKRLWPFLVIQIFAICFSFGLNNFFHLAIVHIVPTFRMMRSHQRVMSLFSALAMPALFVFCLDYFIKTPRVRISDFFHNKKSRAILSVVIIVAIIGFLALFCSLYIYAPGVVERKIIITDLYVILFVVFSAAVVLFLYFKNKISVMKLCLALTVVVWIDLYASVGSLHTNRGSLEDINMPNDWEQFLLQEQSKQGIQNKFRSKSQFHQGSMCATYMGLESYNGYSSLRPHKWSEFISGARKRGEMEKLLDLYNVRFDMDASAKAKQIIDRASTITPRVYTVHEIKHAPWPEVISLIFTNTFNPKTTAFVSEEIEVQPEKHNSDKVKIKKYESTYRLVEVSMTSTGLLVFSEHNYPGWEAKVDGKKVKVWDVNGILTGIIVGPGNHKVEMYFAPKSVYLGLTISGITWCFFVILFWQMYGSAKYRSILSSYRLKHCANG